MNEEQTALALKSFKRCVELIGQSGLARACKCTPGNINQLLTRERPLPGEYVLAAEAATGVSRHDIRPDLYPRGLQDDRPYLPPSERFLTVDKPAVACDRSFELQANAA